MAKNKLNIKVFSQFLRYGISGGFATITHIFVFYIVAWKLFPSLQENDIAVTFLGLSVADVDVTTRSLNSMLSNIIAFLFSNMVAYLINIYWVFEPGRHHKIKEIFLFYLVSGISILVGTSLMGFLINHYEIQTTIAFSANLVAALFINFTVRKFYIFKN